MDIEFDETDLDWLAYSDRQTAIAMRERLPLPRHSDLKREWQERLRITRQEWAAREAGKPLPRRADLVQRYSELLPQRPQLRLVYSRD